MPALMTWGGVAFAVLGVLVIVAGMPDRWSGLGMGSDLLHAGATLLAGGLIVAALGQVLRGLRDIADRVEEAGFGSAGRTSIDDERAEQTPVPLPRAAAAAAPATATAAAAPAAAPRPGDLVAKLEAEMQAEAAKRPEARAQQAAPAPPPSSPPQQQRDNRDPLSRALRDRAAAPRPERDTPAQPDAQRATPRPPLPEPSARKETPAEEPAEERAPEPRRETPRWMRKQQNPQPSPESPPLPPLPETVPVRPTRPLAASATVPPPRVREPHAIPQYESIPRRRREPEPQPAHEEEPGLVVRSGIIGGMAYTLYSDGSIEAELPIGTVRFGSLAELQEHVKRAGAEPDGDFKGPAGDR